MKKRAVMKSLCLDQVRVGVAHDGELRAFVCDDDGDDA